MTITVTGAASARAARVIGLAIANSPLVKTAIAGEDANWGRIVMAVGKAGERADRDRLEISIGGHPITEGGQVRPGYDEAPVDEHMKGQEIFDRDRRRRGTRALDRMDLRPDPRVHRHQCRLP